MDVFLSLMKDFYHVFWLLFNKPRPELVFDLPMGCTNLHKVKILVLFKQKGTEAWENLSSYYVWTMLNYKGAVQILCSNNELKGWDFILRVSYYPNHDLYIRWHKNKSKKVHQNQKGFIKCRRKSRSWEKCLDVFVTMTLVRVEPEETLGVLLPHDIIWNGSFSVTRGVFKCTNHRSANRLLSNALFSLITAPKTRYLEKIHIIHAYVFTLWGGGIVNKKMTNYRWKMKWRRFRDYSPRLHIWHLNTPRSGRQMDQIQWNKQMEPFFLTYTKPVVLF